MSKNDHNHCHHFSYDFPMIFLCGLCFVEGFVGEQHRSLQKNRRRRTGVRWGRNERISQQAALGSNYGGGQTWATNHVTFHVSRCRTQQGLPSRLTRQYFRSPRCTCFGWQPRRLLFELQLAAPRYHFQIEVWSGLDLTEQENSLHPQFIPSGNSLHPQWMKRPASSRVFGQLEVPRKSFRKARRSRVTVMAYNGKALMVSWALSRKHW